MTDIEVIFLVITGFYLGECAVWIRTGMFVFTRQVWFGPYRRASLQWALLRNTDGGIMLGNLLPLGQASACQQWPLSLSPFGVYGYVSQALSPDGRPLQPERFVEFADIQSVDVQGVHLCINNVRFSRAASASFAHLLAATVRLLVELPQDQRAQAIETALANHLDAEAIRQRLALFRRLSADLQLTCSLLFFLVFILAPLLVHLESSFPLVGFLGPYLGLCLLALLQFRHAHAELYPHERGERWKAIFTMLLSPADLLHARDKLAKHLLTEFHPLAVASVVCRLASFQTLAAYIWRDLAHPMLPICPAPDSGPRQTEEWFRNLMQTQIGRVLEQAGVNPCEWLCPPPPEDKFCRTYCPRCLGQYVLESGSCADCGGRALLPLTTQEKPANQNKQTHPTPA